MDPRAHQFSVLLAGRNGADGRRDGETPIVTPPVRPGMLALPALLGLDPLFVLLAVGFLGLFFFGFLLLRKTMLGFKEGVDEGRR